MQVTLGERPFSVRTIEVDVAGVGSPVALRPGTSDEPTFIEVFVHRQYDFDFGGLKPKLIIDGGANVGFASLWFKSLFPESAVVAVEPEHSNCLQYLQNLREYENTKLIEGALWPVAGTGYLVKQQGGTPLEHWAFQVSDTQIEGCIQTRLITIGEIFNESGASTIDLLKLDIEGAEAELFAEGTESWLPHVQNLVIEFHELLRPGSAQRIIEKLASSDWQISERGNNFHFRR